MDLKELQTFKTILLEGSFSKAALKLNYAQSTITMQIQRLEKEIGFRIFERGADMNLTPSGVLFANEIDNLIDHWNFTVAYAKKLEREEVGTLNIGICEPIARESFPKIISDFRMIKPNIVCNLVIENTDGLCKLLDQQTLDFLVTAKPKNMDKYHFEELYREEVSFVVSKQYQELMRDIRNMEDLSRYPLFTGGQNCLYHAKMNNIFSEFTEHPFCYSINKISEIPYFLHEFPSIGAIAKSVKLPNNVMELSVNLDDPHMPIGIVTRKSDKQYLLETKKALLDIIRNALRG